MTIPAFLSAELAVDGSFDVGPVVTVLYEQGSGGAQQLVTGTVLYPKPEKSEDILFPGDLLYIFPGKDRNGNAVQSETRARMLQINKKYIIEIASDILSAEYDEEEDPDE